VSVGRELLVEVVAALKADPELARELRELLGVAAAKAPEPTPIYMRVAEYAKRVSLSERTLWYLVPKGLPVVGDGPARRVDVARADTWLRERSAQLDDAVEREARAAAAKAARKAAT
jgi:hypothetical protein